MTGGSHMSTLAVTNALESVLVPIGTAGAVLAVVCALITAVALARGAAGLAGGGIGVWMAGALLSLCASFATLWTPSLVSAGALVAAFVIGGVLRMLRRGSRAARTGIRVEVDADESARASASRAPARSIPARTITETVRVAS